MTMRPFGPIPVTRSARGTSGSAPAMCALNSRQLED